MDHLKRLLERYPALCGMKEEIERAYGLLETAYSQGGKLLVCGNGGSAADSDHIVGELMKGFYKKRPLSDAEKDGLGDLGNRLQGALPAVSLTGHSALSTAFLNDVDPEMVFAQQVYGYGRRGDVLAAISTSGNSVNVVNAARVAKAKGLSVISLTGSAGGCLKGNQSRMPCGAGGGDSRRPGTASSRLSYAVRDAGGSFLPRCRRRVNWLRGRLGSCLPERRRLPFCVVENMSVASMGKV